MTTASKAIPDIPKETARAANAVFGRGNFYILIGERLEDILEDIQLQRSSERPGGSTVEAVILPLITIFQFVEGLTDIQAIDAVRMRIDWKFALHLSLIPTMFRDNALCEFRQRIFTDSFSQQEFQKLIDRLIMLAPALHSKFPNLKNSELLAFVCSTNRLDRTQQAMQQALEVLASRFPDWLRKIALPHWYGRYNLTAARLGLADPACQQQFLMEEIGTDIHYFLENIHRSGPREISDLHEIKMLDQVASEQFLAQCQFEEDGYQIKPRAMNCSSCLFMH